MITICHITTLTTMGGVEKMLFDFLRYDISRMDKTIRHIVVATSSKKEVIDEFRKHKIEVYQPTRYFKFDLIFLLRLYFFLKQRKVIIVHTYNTNSNILGTLISICAGIKNIVTSEHGTVWQNKGLKLVMEKFLLKFAKVCVSNSEASKVFLINKYKVNESKIKVILNGVDLESITKTTSGKLKEELGFNDDDVIIGTIGRLDSPKNHFNFIDIALEAKLQKLNYKFVVIGNGPLKEKLELYVKNNNLTNHVFLLGFRSDARELITDFTIYLSTSIRESFGNTLVEAAFCKKIVIAPLIDGIPEVLPNNICARLLVPIETIKHKEISGNMPKHVIMEGKFAQPKSLAPKEVINTIKDILSDKNQMVNMSEKAHHFVSNNFNINTYWTNLNNLYIHIDS